VTADDRLSNVDLGGDVEQRTALGQRRVGAVSNTC
jgi:hypothetical protein